MKKLIRLSTMILLLICIPKVTYNQGVDFAIFRLDYETFDIKGVCEFSQNYRKAVPDPGHQVGNIFVFQVYPMDYGYTLIKSRLTGQQIFKASIVWMGQGQMIFPHDSDFVDDSGMSYSNPSPDTIMYLFTSGENENNYASAWERVKNTAAIKTISATYNYEVVVFPHIYGAGGSPANPEWIVIAYNVPPAPTDIGIVDILWPKITQTLNIAAHPEILLYNFSDEAVNITASVLITDEERTYSAAKVITSFDPDSYQNVSFDCFLPGSLGDVRMKYSILDSEGMPIEDNFNDNNEVSDTIRISAEPVFKYTWLPSDTALSDNTMAVDIDGDGDMDIVQWGYGAYSNLLRNEGDLIFIPLTDPSSLTISSNTYDLLVTDLTGEGNPDLLTVAFEQPPVLYKGDGAGHFEDITIASGLSTITTYYDVKSIDLENDNDMDLIFQSHKQEIIMKNNGAGVFTDFTAETGIIDTFQTEEVGVGDLNNDQFSDVILANWDKPSKVFLNDKNGHFTEQTTNWTFEYSRGAKIFDFDDDGLNDILIPRRLYTEKTLLYKNNNAFGSGNPFSLFASLPESFHADATDLNDDGLAEILLDNYLLSYQNSEIIDITYTLNGSSISGGQFADMNNDNFTDIFYNGCYINQSNVTCKDFVNEDHYERIKSELSLSIYPNPFTDNISINYTLDESALAKIDILDLTGRELVNLYEGMQSEGNHEINWNTHSANGINLSHGIYLVRLETNKSIVTKKLVFIE